MCTAYILLLSVSVANADGLITTQAVVSARRCRVPVKATEHAVLH